MSLQGSREVGEIRTEPWVKRAGEIANWWGRKHPWLRDDFESDILLALCEYRLRQTGELSVALFNDMANKRCKDRIRKEKRHQRGRKPSGTWERAEWAAVPDDVGSEESSGALGFGVEALLEGLSVEDAELVVQHAIEGRSFEKIAVARGVSKGEVSYRYGKAAALVRARVERLTGAGRAR